MCTLVERMQSDTVPVSVKLHCGKVPVHTIAIAYRRVHFGTSNNVMDSGSGIFSTPMHVLVVEDYIQYWYQYVATYVTL